jgi:hypothetical protein
MYMNLVCSGCGDSALVSFASLYDLWKEGYEKLCPEHKKQATAYTEISCHCGHTERYDGPMVKYICQLIFDELVKKEEAV